MVGVDAKAVLIKDGWWYLLLSVDTVTRDIVHFLLEPREDSLAYHDLLWEAVVDTGYPLKGAASDLDPAIEAV
ncbi:TPA: hypothetical protein EYP38_01275, partial [Candidatus Micrarchaeota archaeon]|nr:hypothetical protein [Candidatus Micrarchaeota archaeon]